MENKTRKRIMGVEPLQNPEVVLLERAVSAYKMDQKEIEEVLSHIDNRTDYINGEFAIEFIGKKIRISLLDEKIYCKKTNTIVNFFANKK